MTRKYRNIEGKRGIASKPSARKSRCGLRGVEFGSDGQPPRVVTLELLIREYSGYDKLKLINDLKGFRERNDKLEAMRDAANGRYSDGVRKREHQYRLSNRVLGEVAARVSLDFADHYLADFKSWHEFIVSEYRISGYGDLALHDFALFSFWALKDHPVVDVVYLHAGVLVGFRNLKARLCLNIVPCRDRSGRKYVNREDLPVELQVLTGEQIENFFCMFADEINQI